MARDRSKLPTDATPLKSNPFAALGEKLELPANEGEVAKPEATPEPRSATRRSGPARAVVRLERKGRGGKEVTIVEKLELPAPELLRWLKDLKQTLGTGGVVEGDLLVLQGDHRARLRGVLEERGVRKVTLG